MKKTLFLLLILLLSAITPAAASSDLQDFILFYSNNVQGETEPCG